ncbi:MAG TPA: hypothetical protein VE987_17740 [Polyangiaceae bacterium]|nr:hypothetical protein [Polyangiaceae bacterium]
MTRVIALRLPGLLACLVLAVGGCSKKPPPPPVEDAAPMPASTPTMTELAPLVEDAGPEDAAAEAAAPKKYVGPAVNPNQLRIAACCNAMRAQAKQMGQSPESFQVNAMAAQCDVFAKQVGPAGTAPEFAQLRQILKSVKLPAACNF